MSLGTRAVLLPTRPMEYPRCHSCDKIIHGASVDRQSRVVANIYVGKTWDRMEQWCETCYLAAGMPYGPLLDKAPNG